LVCFLVSFAAVAKSNMLVFLELIKAMKTELHTDTYVWMGMLKISKCDEIGHAIHVNMDATSRL
jgi:hypothetical protein